MTDPDRTDQISTKGHFRLLYPLLSPGNAKYVQAQKKVHRTPPLYIYQEFQNAKSKNFHKTLFALANKKPQMNKYQKF